MVILAAFYDRFCLCRVGLFVDVVPRQNEVQGNVRLAEAGICVFPLFLTGRSASGSSLIEFGIDEALAAISLCVKWSPMITSPTGTRASGPPRADRVLALLSR